MMVNVPSYSVYISPQGPEILLKIQGDAVGTYAAGCRLWPSSLAVRLEDTSKNPLTIALDMLSKS